MSPFSARVRGKKPAYLPAHQHSCAIKCAAADNRPPPPVLFHTTGHYLSVDLKGNRTRMNVLRCSALLWSAFYLACSHSDLMSQHQLWSMQYSRATCSFNAEITAHRVICGYCTHRRCYAVHASRLSKARHLISIVTSGTTATAIKRGFKKKKIMNEATSWPLPV